MKKTNRDVFLQSKNYQNLYYRIKIISQKIKKIMKQKKMKLIINSIIKKKLE